MKKVLAALALLFAISSPAYAACTLQHADLPDSIIKEMEAACAKKEEELAQKAQELKFAPSSVEQMSKYAEVATQVAGALGIAARELGMAANDFLQTPAGVFVAFIILFKVLGPTIVAFMSTALLLLLAGKVLRVMWNRDTGETQEVTNRWGTKRTVRVYHRLTYREQEDTAIFWSLVILIVCVIPLVGAAFI